MNSVLSWQKKTKVFHLRGGSAMHKIKREGELTPPFRGQKEEGNSKSCMEPGPQESLWGLLGAEGIFPFTRSNGDWVCVNPGSWWWTGRPGLLWFMELQRVGHDWATELNWTEWGLTNWPEVTRQVKGDSMETHPRTLIWAYFLSIHQLPSNFLFSDSFLCLN